MTFIHKDPDFHNLLGIVAEATGISRALIEKDYWVVHSLWALHDGRFEVWFKGGTSLSKGFGLIERFSEDLDLKIELRDLDAIPAVNWKKDKAQHVSKRIVWWQQLAAMLVVPDAGVVVDHEPWRKNGPDCKAHSGCLRVIYPGRHTVELSGHNPPFVKLELGDARVLPFVVRPVSSFVHDHLISLGQLAEFVDNRPHEVRHVHPWVTLLEKLNAIMKWYGRPDAGAARFVRHYEDAARIAAAVLPPPAGYTLATLAAEMRATTLRSIPAPTDPCLALAEPGRRNELERAHDDLDGMYWGSRLSLGDACAVLRDWLLDAAFPR